MTILEVSDTAVCLSNVSTGLKKSCNSVSFSLRAPIVVYIICGLLQGGVRDFFRVPFAMGLKKICHTEHLQWERSVSYSRVSFILKNNWHSLKQWGKISYKSFILNYLNLPLKSVYQNIFYHPKEICKIKANKWSLSFFEDKNVQI